MRGFVRHGGARHLSIRTEKGESFLVPEWMTQSDAAAAKVVDAPCIPSLSFALFGPSWIRS